VHYSHTQIQGRAFLLRDCTCVECTRFRRYPYSKERHTRVISIVSQPKERAWLTSFDVVLTARLRQTPQERSKAMIVLDSLGIRVVCPNVRASPPSALPKPGGGRAGGATTRFIASCRRPDSERLECGSNATVHPVDTTLGNFRKWVPGLLAGIPDFTGCASRENNQWGCKISGMIWLSV